MPRTTLTPTSIPGGTSQIRFAEFTWTAADVANGNQFLSTGYEELLIRNVNAASPGVSYIVTVYGLQGEIQYTLAAGVYVSLGKFPTSGWRQTDTYIYIDGANADLEFAVLKHPS